MVKCYGGRAAVKNAAIKMCEKVLMIDSKKQKIRTTVDLLCS